MIPYEQRRDLVTAMTDLSLGKEKAAAYAGLTYRQALTVAREEGLAQQLDKTDPANITDDEIDRILINSDIGDSANFFGISIEDAKECKDLAILMSKSVPRYLQKFLDPNTDLQEIEQNLSKHRKRNRKWK